MKTRTFIKHFIKSKMFTLIALLVLLIIVFTVITNGQFIAPNNLRSVLQTTSVIGLLTVGVGALMIAGYVDLSVGGVGSMCAILCAVMMRDGAPVWLSIISSIVLGGICGAINVFLINKLNFQPFIATLAMAQIAEGFAYVFSKAQLIRINSTFLSTIGGGRLLKYIPYSVLIVIAAFIIYALLMNKTRFGRSVYMIGANPEASRLSGLHPKRITTILFINSGVMAAIAGLLLTARVGTATANGIVNTRFAGITAAVLGGISFGGGTGGMAGAFVGLLILGSFNNAMTLIGIHAYLQQTASGLLLIVALVIDYIIIRRRRKLSLLSAAATEDGGDNK